MVDVDARAREPKEHQIKCWPELFQAMLEGRKTAEFRLNDRDYRVGDVLWIREWCPEAGAYTDRSLTRRISHVLSSGFGLPEGYAMLSLDPEIARLRAEQREADARVAWKVADDIAHEARAESLDHRWFQDGREAGAREVLASIRGAQ